MTQVAYSGRRGDRDLFYRTGYAVRSNCVQVIQRTTFYVISMCRQYNR